MDIGELEVYRLAEDLAVDIYRMVKKFPKSEQYGLVSQLTRAGVSVPANIAESWGRYHYKDRLQFLYHARGSLVELWSLLRIAERLEYTKKDGSLDDAIKILRIKLQNYIEATRKRSKQ